MSAQVWQRKRLEELLSSIRLSQSSCSKCSSVNNARRHVLTNALQIIDGRVLCVHGGLSPDVRTLDQIRIIARAQEVPHEGAFCGKSKHKGCVPGL